MTRMQPPLPHEIALISARREMPREVCVPLYLPAFAPEMLSDGPAPEAQDDIAEVDFGATADVWSVYDEDDDSDD